MVLSILSAFLFQVTQEMIATLKVASANGHSLPMVSSTGLVTRALQRHLALDRSMTIHAATQVYALRMFRDILLKPLFSLKTFISKSLSQKNGLVSHGPVGCRVNQTLQISFTNPSLQSTHFSSYI